MDPQKVKSTQRKHRRSVHLTIRVSPDIKYWLREKGYSPTAIFYEAIKDLGEITIIDSGDNSLINREFDLLIGQNLNEFDVKVLNGRAWSLGLTPLRTILSVDTLTSSRFTMRLCSHKLDSMAQEAGLGKKIKQDMQDCIGTAKGDKRISDRRLRYNNRDVVIGAKVFWSQIDYYKIPKKLLNLLKLYVKSDDPTFCIPCAAERQARFNLTKRKIKGGYRLHCDTCDYEWDIRNE